MCAIRPSHSPSSYRYLGYGILLNESSPNGVSTRFALMEFWIFTSPQSSARIPYFPTANLPVATLGIRSDLYLNGERYFGILSVDRGYPYPRHVAQDYDFLYDAPAGAYLH